MAEIRVGIGESRFSVPKPNALYDVNVKFTVDEFAALALANGYDKLEPGQVVVDAGQLQAIIKNDCDYCAKLGDPHCERCFVATIRNRIKEVSDE